MKVQVLCSPLEAASTICQAVKSSTTVQEFQMLEYKYPKFTYKTRSLQAGVTVLIKALEVCNVPLVVHLLEVCPELAFMPCDGGMSPLFHLCWTTATSILDSPSADIILVQLARRLLQVNPEVNSLATSSTYHLYNGVFGAGCSPLFAAMKLDLQDLTTRRPQLIEFLQSRGAKRVTGSTDTLAISDFFWSGKC